MSNIKPWTADELDNATARPLDRATAAGRWYAVQANGDAPDAIAVAGLGIYDLTLAGNAYYALQAALDLGSRRMSAEQEMLVGHLLRVAAAAIERGEPVRMTSFDFDQLDLAPYIDKDDFGAALMFRDDDTDRPTALCVFGAGESGVSGPQTIQS